MNPQILIAVLRYFFWRQQDSTTSKKGRSKKSSSSGKVFGIPTAFITIVAAAYFGVGPDKLQELILGKAEQVLVQVGQQLEDGGDSTNIPAASGSIRIYFTVPPGNPADTNDIGHACAGYIDQAKQTVDLAGFEINNTLIVEALIKAAGRGVKVRVVTDTDYVKEPSITALKQAGIPVVDDQRSALMHNKFIVFDGNAVWTGSMNFTENCAYKNNNNGIYLAVPQVAANYATKFRWLFESRMFGKKPTGESIPNPVVTLSDGTVIENYFAPHDHCADHLVAAIQQSTKTLDFLAFNFTHAKIGQAVADRAAAGVQIRGVFEKTQTAGGSSQYSKLKNLGLPVYLDANPRNMHHKVMVFDGTTTVTGSFNFSESADKSNDENMLIIRNNPKIAKRYEGEVQRVFNAARGAGQ